VAEANPMSGANAESRIEVLLERDGFALDVKLAWNEPALVLFGPSGSGKSTLLASVLGLFRHGSARICLAGSWLEDSSKGTRLTTHARALGWVPQDAILFPHLDVRGNLGFGQRRAGHGGKAALDRAIEVLELGSLLDRPVAALSGGERSRVALGRALASGPRALLLDEPLASLDVPLRARVLPYLLRVRDELGLPMIYITHDPDEAMLLGDRVAVLNEGRIVADGDPTEVLWSQAVLPLSAALGLENVLEAVVEASQGEECTARTAQGLRLVLPWTLQPGNEICLGIPAHEILLATREPTEISARNIIAGTISRVERESGDALIHIDAGERIVAKLTPSAADRLGLDTGKHVYVIIKAHALRHVR
jgi:molybdate transport system ATP-binding protein